MDKQQRRESLFKRWQDLRQACNAFHAGSMRDKAGGAVVCICGQGCGGSGACSMLGELRDLVRYLPTGGLPAEWRERIEELRSVI